MAMSLRKRIQVHCMDLGIGLRPIGRSTSKGDNDRVTKTVVDLFCHDFIRRDPRGGSSYTVIRAQNTDRTDHQTEAKLIDDAALRQASDS
jgi:hypothetical protein